MANKFIRDTLVLAAFCGVFYLVTLSINWFVSEENLITSNEYSSDRTKADYYSKKNDWNKIIEYYQKLTKSDEFNQHAWDKLGDAYFRMRIALSLGVSREEHKNPPNQERIRNYRNALKDLTAKATPALLRAAEFPRYRPSAYYRLARMYAYDGNEAKAIEYLRESMNSGYRSGIRGGIRNEREFRSIRGYDEFESIRDQEIVNWQKWREKLQRQ